MQRFFDRGMPLSWLHLKPQNSPYSGMQMLQHALCPLLKQLSRAAIFLGLAIVLAMPQTSRAMNAQEAAQLLAQIPESDIGAECTWHQLLNPAGINFAYPDLNASYFTAFIKPPTSTQTYVMKGYYPDVRYFSFSSYYQTSSPFYTLDDYEIPAAAGGTSPFIGITAIDSSIAFGDTYRLNLIYIPKDEQANLLDPQTGSFYMTQSMPDGTAVVIYRTYVSSNKLNGSGGVSLPEIDVVEHGKSQPLNASAACPSAQNILLKLSGRDSRYNERNLKGWPVVNSTTPRANVISNPPNFQVYYNLAAFFNAYDRYHHAPNGGSDLHHPLFGHNDPTTEESSGGFYLEGSTTYAVAPFSRDYGDVYMVRGHAPSVTDGSSNPAQVRYWSACDYEGYRTAVIACFYDNMANLDEDGFYTVVVADQPDRPAWANPARKINWLPWGFTRTSTLIVRQMLADPGFSQSFSSVPQGINPYSISGDYFPIGTYCSREAVRRMPDTLTPAQMFKYCASSQPNRYINR